jgi:hypothetical protein
MRYRCQQSPPTASQRTSSPPLRRLTTAPNIAIATLWADMLTSGGIRSTVQRYFASSIAGEIPPDQALPRSGSRRRAIRRRAPARRIAPPAAPPLGLPRLRRDDRRAVRAVLELRHGDARGGVALKHAFAA